MYLESLPKEIINKIMIYNSHPVADLVREEIDRFLADDDDLTEFSCLYFEQHYNNHCKRYCGSCDYYYPKVCICCPRCD